MSQTAQVSLFPAKQTSVQGPWPLPSGWEWVPLGELCEAIVGGGTPDRRNPRYRGDTISWAEVGEMCCLQAQDAALLGQLERSILERAFREEL